MNYLPALGKAMATIFANAAKSQPGLVLARHRCRRGRIGLLAIDAPVTQFIERDRASRYGAADKRARTQDAKIAVEKFDFRFPGFGGPAFHPVHWRDHPCLTIYATGAGRMELRRRRFLKKGLGLCSEFRDEVADAGASRQAPPTSLIACDGAFGCRDSTRRHCLATCPSAGKAPCPIQAEKGESR